jgi:hypothetical protein
LAQYEKLLDSVHVTGDRVRRSLSATTVSPRAIVAYQQDLPVTFAVSFFNFSTFEGLPGLCLKNILVLPAFQKKIFAFLPGRAMESGCSRVELSVLN